MFVVCNDIRFPSILSTLPSPSSPEDVLNSKKMILVSTYIRNHYSKLVVIYNGIKLSPIVIKDINISYFGYGLFPDAVSVVTQVEE